MSTGMKNTGIDDNETFDRDMRKLYSAAVDHVSPQTLARLRAARHAAQTAPRPGHAWRWIAATAFSAVLAVAIGLQFQPQSAPAPTTQPMVASDASGDYNGGVPTLDENPDLYLWLASAEAEPLAME